MALVTIQRSPSSGSSTNQDDPSSFDDVDTNKNPKSLSECCYFAGKGTALVLPDADANAQHGGGAAAAQRFTCAGTTPSEECAADDPPGSNGSAGATNTGSTTTGSGSTTIQKHLQSMFYLLRPEETLKMAVKLESTHPTRTRYLVVVSRMGARGEESCLLGIDCNERTTVGLVLKVLANTTITLDGDGGFRVSICDRHHIFKPVSVQAMWSALQTLHKVSAKARDLNYFQPQPGGTTTHHAWVNYYHVTSDQSCLNEWYAMDNLETRRPPSPDSLRNRPKEGEETERVIRSTLKEIMMSVDLDEVTSKMIRSRLEEVMDMDLEEYKSFIDQEMLVILGQMDAPTEIFDHVYLGSEWNASNYDELKKNGVGHILNVTMEIDNFFPGTFDYLNVRVYDDEKTDLLKHWDDTFKYITKAKQQGSKVLVHCKMGVSRSASVVIAYAMKAHNWDFQKAITHVKTKRSCIKPNTNFLSQLETYQGILDAMKNKEKLQRSKSETNLNSPTNSSKNVKVKEPVPVQQDLSKSYDFRSTLSGQDLRHMGVRPKSWSPDNLETRDNRTKLKASPNSVSLEDLSQKETVQDCKVSLARHVLMPCDNGESYSVSPNQIVHLPGHELPVRCEDNLDSTPIGESSRVVSRFGEVNQPSSCNFSAKKPTTDTWDPGEYTVQCEDRNNKQPICDQKTSSNVVSEGVMWTSTSTIVKTESAVSSINFSDSNSQNVPESQRAKTVSDPFSNQLDRVFDREEKKQQRVSLISTDQPIDKILRESPSRQSSWSSYDSAVAMSFPEKENNTELSRHSSWGSGDTRVLPSRNSSWGSYDIRPRGSVYYSNEKGEKVLHSTSDLENSSSGIFPYNKEEIPWHPGTVKRTKQRLENNGTSRQLSSDSTTSSSCLSLVKTPSQETLTTNFVEAVNEVLVDRGKTTVEESSSAISDRINIPVEDKLGSRNSRLSISAPEPSAMELITTDCSLSRSASNVSEKDTTSAQVPNSVVKQHKSFLESLQQKENAQLVHKKAQAEDSLDNASLGKVKNLKKEFEAKSTSTVSGTEDVSLKVPKSRGSSLPSSPVCTHQVKEPPPQKTNDDMSFKSLRSVFEKDTNQVKLRQKFGKSNTQNKPNRFSCFEVTVDKTPKILQTPLITNLSRADNNESEYRRPPIVPAVKNIAQTVIAAAKKQQQQYGKSHPLAKLNIKPRHNNPVYNTM